MIYYQTVAKPATVSKFFDRMKSVRKGVNNTQVPKEKLEHRLVYYFSL